MELQVFMPLKLLKQLSCLTILLGCVFSNQAWSQQLTSEQIKSAYLYNFLLHVQWPDEPKKKQFNVAIYQDKHVFDSIFQTLNNRQVKSKPVVVKLVNNIDKARQADVVFVSVTEDIDISTIASDLRSTSTLLVTDNSIDKHNIMINLLFNPQSSAITFEVNKSNIVFEKLEVSPELLLLGGTEIDVAELYRETELAMQAMRQREAKLNLTLASQTEQLTTINARLKRLNQDLKTREMVAQHRQTELVKLKKNIDEQKQMVAKKEKQLGEVVDQMSVAIADLESKQTMVEQREQESKEMAARIAANQEILDEQKSQIDQQGLQLNRKNAELEERKARIEQQKFYLLVLGVLITVALIIGGLVIILFIKNKRTTRKLSQTLTNLKSMQDQLVQSEKLASLGKLTAGVAHEINTPLGIAVTSTSSMLESTKTLKYDFEQQAITKSAMSRYFKSMEQAADLNMSSLNRVIELLNNFKQVAADQVVGEVREINLAEYINEIMQTLSAELKRFRVKYTFHGHDDIEINTVPGAIAQVITNLVTNSLKHGFSDCDAGNIAIELTRNGDAIEIVYTDDGEGMTTEVLLNIFEPFFTTKRSSGGTGLGMNIVYNIIKQKLQGEIDVKSEPQQGAKFIITLPKAIK